MVCDLSPVMGSLVCDLVTPGGAGAGMALVARAETKMARVVNASFILGGLFQMNAVGMMGTGVVRKQDEVLYIYIFDLLPLPQLRELMM